MARSQNIWLWCRSNRDNMVLDRRYTPRHRTRRLYTSHLYTVGCVSCYRSHLIVYTRSTVPILSSRLKELGVSVIFRIIEWFIRQCHLFRCQKIEERHYQIWLQISINCVVITISDFSCINYYWIEQFLSWLQKPFICIRLFTVSKNVGNNLTKMLKKSNLTSDSDSVLNTD